MEYKCEYKACSLSSIVRISSLYVIQLRQPVPRQAPNYAHRSRKVIFNSDRFPNPFLIAHFCRIGDKLFGKTKFQILAQFSKPQESDGFDCFSDYYFRLHRRRSLDWSRRLYYIVKVVHSPHGGMWCYMWTTTYIANSKDKNAESIQWGGGEATTRRFGANRLSKEATDEQRGQKRWRWIWYRNYNLRWEFRFFTGPVHFSFLALI